MMTNYWQECVVRLATVVNTHVNMRAHSQYNPFQRGMLKASVEKANKHGAWWISDEDHTFQWKSHTIEKNAMNMMRI